MSFLSNISDRLLEVADKVAVQRSQRFRVLFQASRQSLFVGETTTGTKVLNFDAQIRRIEFREDQAHLIEDSERVRLTLYLDNDFVAEAEEAQAFENAYYLDTIIELGQPYTRNDGKVIKQARILRAAFGRTADEASEAYEQLRTLKQQQKQQPAEKDDAETLGL